MVATQDLIDWWARHRDPDPFHPEDLAGIEPAADRFDPQRIPVPFLGPLDRPIVVLLSNPGIRDGGVEERIRDADPRVRAIFAEQRTGKGRFPFELPFDIEPLGWMGYMRKRMACALDVTEKETFLANACVVQVSPYASEGWAKISFVASRLPSATIVRRWLHDTVMPAARSQQRFVIFGRAADHWGLSDERGGLTIYRVPPRWPSTGEANRAALRWLQREG